VNSKATKLKPKISAAPTLRYAGFYVQQKIAARLYHKSPMPTQHKTLRESTIHIVN